MNLVEKINLINKTYENIARFPKEGPILHKRLFRALDKQGLTDFWEDELYERLELVDSDTAQQNAQANPIDPIDNDESAKEAELIAKSVPEKDDDDYAYCDLFSNHVLANEEIMERLEHQKRAYVAEVHGDINTALAEHDPNEAVVTLQDEFQDMLYSYLKEHHINNAEVLLPDLEKKLADTVVAMDYDHLNLGKVKDLVHQIQSIQDDEIVWVDVQNLKTLSEGDILDIFLHLRNKILS